MVSRLALGQYHSSTPLVGVIGLGIWLHSSTLAVTDLVTFYQGALNTKKLSRLDIIMYFVSCLLVGNRYQLHFCNNRLLE